MSPATEASQLLTSPIEIFCSALDTIAGTLLVYTLLKKHQLFKVLCFALLVFGHGF